MYLIIGQDFHKSRMFKACLLYTSRVSMPDIDVDFCYERRQEVIDYVVRKYGKDRVVQILSLIHI